MGSEVKLYDVGLNAQAEAFAKLLNNGFLRLYDGIQPADADTPVSSQRLLAELRFSTPAFGQASKGTVKANLIGKAEAVATGLASWFRCLEKDGTTTVIDGSVGTSLCDVNLNDSKVNQGAEVTVPSFSYTV
jgi:hypothetical protein